MPGTSLLLGRRVLLVDDDPLLRTVYSLALRDAGCQVAEAADGAECLGLVRALRPELVLMDLSMPGMDGWNALAALRGDAEAAGVAVVAVTATTTQLVRARAAEAGFDGFVEKPFSAGAFLHAVERAFADALSSRGLRGATAGDGGHASSA